jgi:predicted PurR-regulated permease PerM
MNTSIVVIVFVAALLFSVGFLVLVLTLVPAINQLKSLLADLERTSSQFRDLTIRLKILSEKVDQDLDKVDAVLDSSKETVEVVSDSLKYININILKKSAGLLAFIPAIKFGWNLVKKIKGGKKYE